MKEKILKDINDNGFHLNQFHEFNEIKSEMLTSKIPSEKLSISVKQLLQTFGFEPRPLHLVYEDLYFNEGHIMHTHLTPCDFQVLIWACKKKYEGREFIYGTKSNLQKHQPEFGDICFMKTNDLDFIHGVEPLKSKVTVRTLLISYNYSGKTGEHLTVTSGDLNPV